MRIRTDTTVTLHPDKGVSSACVLMRLLLPAFLIAAALPGYAEAPKGMLLNLDFQNIEDGLIPNNTLYPIYVPIADIGTNSANNRTILVFKEGQGLDIPHTSLLDPDGSGWVAGIRVFAFTDGMIMSQSDGEKGYALFIKDGAVHAAIQTGYSTVFLRERPENGITECLNKWVSIELIIKPDVAILSLNRAHVALLPMEIPLQGSDYRIRLGEHETLPALLARSKAIEPTGFTGAISSFKILRQ